MANAVLLCTSSLSTYCKLWQVVSRYFSEVHAPLLDIVPTEAGVVFPLQTVRVSMVSLFVLVWLIDCLDCQYFFWQERGEPIADKKIGIVFCGRQAREILLCKVLRNSRTSVLRTFEQSLAPEMTENR